jgi:hypothetical protein
MVVYSRGRQERNDTHDESASSQSIQRPLELAFAPAQGQQSETKQHKPRRRVNGHARITPPTNAKQRIRDIADERQAANDD